jgi:phage terminase large subunit-like protein
MARTGLNRGKAAAMTVEQLAARVGLSLEPFQRKIVRAVLGPEREALVLIPRGNGKTTLMALVALHHLLTTPGARIYCVASSRAQAAILFEAALDFARRLAHENIVERYLELRWCEDPDRPTVFSRQMRVLAADGPKIHGLSPTLMILDELQAVTRADLYPALASALHKRPDSKLVTISTAGSGADSPLGALRQRALGLRSVKRRGALTDAQGADLRMLDWSVPAERELTTREVKRANPASWITTADLAEQRQRLPDLAFRRFLCNQWTAAIGSWLPAGAWQDCAGETRFEAGERIWVGIDVGGSRADTAVVWVNERLDVDCRIFSGEDAVLDAAALVPELAERYQVVEVVYDPWRAQQMALEWEQRRLRVVKFPQSDSRMIPASSALYDAITQGRLTHPDDPDLNAHVAAAVAKSSRRGWRLDQAPGGGNIDGVIALCMAVERASEPPQEVRLIGWL